MRRTLLLLLLLVLPFAYSLSCGLNLPEKNQSKIDFTEEKEVSAVRVLSEEKPLVMTATARLVPTERFEITSFAGVGVKRVFVDEGQRVSQGETLLEFQEEDFEARLDFARAELTEAEAAVVDYNYMIQNKEALLEEEKISDTIANGLAKKLAHAKATVTRAQAEIEYFDKKEAPEPVVAAAFDGLVSKKDVSSGSSPAPGKLLMELVKLDPIALHFHVPYEFVDSITRDIPVSAKFSSIPGREFKAQIQMIGPDIDVARQTIEIKALLPNREESLKPGLTAKVTLRTDRRTRTLVVPAKAVWEEKGVDYIYRIANKKLQKVSVDMGEKTENQVSITRGLRENDLVVVSDRDELRDATPVSVQILEDD